MPLLLYWHEGVWCVLLMCWLYPLCCVSGVCFADGLVISFCVLCVCV
jgi:hypothetical protein